MSDQLRKYEVRVCPDHGQAHVRFDSCRAVVDRSATGRVTYCGKGPLRTAIDERDVQPLVDAVNDTLCDNPDCTRCNFLRGPLAPFSTQSEEKQP